jgi:hypothetical protein
VALEAACSRAASGGDVLVRSNPGKGLSATCCALQDF